MAQVRHIRPGYAVINPNRDKLRCKLTRVVVVLILLASVGLMLAVTFGGWSKLQGMKPVNFAWAALYLVMAFYILRWARGLLPIAAALAILLLIIAVIAGTGLAGTSFFDRGTGPFAAAHSIFGGHGLSSHTLGVVTVLLIPVQAALIVVAIIGFSQGWNVELEVPEEEARRRGSTPIARGPQVAAT